MHRFRQYFFVLGLCLLLNPALASSAEQNVERDAESVRSAFAPPVIIGDESAGANPPPTSELLLGATMILGVGGLLWVRRRCTTL